MKCHSPRLQFYAALLVFSACEGPCYGNKARSKVFSIRNVALKVLDEALHYYFRFLLSWQLMLTVS